MSNLKFNCEHVNLHYGDFHALKDINMKICANEITAFIGPSGCGKSTFLKTLNEVIVANMQNPDFCLDDMASLLNMSRSSLNRKIKGVLDMTPNDYIRLERLKKAAQLLREGECKVNEVCYMVGFNTPSYFTKCFQKQFGILPKDFVK